MTLARSPIAVLSIGAAFELTDGLSRLEKGTKRLSPGPSPAQAQGVGEELNMETCYGRVVCWQVSLLIAVES